MMPVEMKQKLNRAENTIKYLNGCLRSIEDDIAKSPTCQTQRMALNRVRDAIAHVRGYERGESDEVW